MMRLKFFKAVFFLSVTFLSVATLWVSEGVAQANLEKVGVVNIQKVIDSSELGKKAKRDLEGSMKEQQKEIERLTQKAEALRSTVQKQAAILSKEALEEKMEGVKKVEREARRALMDSREEMKRKNDALMRRLINEVDVVLGELAKEEGVNFILNNDRRSIVYASSELDLSDKVIERLNKK